MPLRCPVTSEVLARLPWYADDWKAGFSSRRVPAAAVFIYFASLFPAITFGFYISSHSNDQMGVVEVLVATGVCGALFSILAGQPLVIIGVTGPLAIFTGAVYSFASSVEISFLPFLSWIYIWAAAMHFCLALGGFCALVRYVTRYSCEIFGFLISVIYMQSAVQVLFDIFLQQGIDADQQTSEQVKVGVGLMSLVIAMATLLTSLALHHAEKWRFFNPFIRYALAAYGTFLCVVFYTFIVYWPYFASLPTPTLAGPVPASFAPTTNRSWLVSYSDLPGWAIIAAIIPAVFLTLLIFFDHNISSLMAQSPKFRLQKPSAYNYDFFVIGLLLIFCSIIGLPPAHGLIPQAPMHVRALGTIRTKKVTVYYQTGDGERVKEFIEREICDGVTETRLANFLQSVGVTVSLAILPVIRLIPLAALSGLFAFMSLVELPGNQFFNRLLLFITDPRRRLHSHYLILPLRRIALWTASQLFWLIIIFAVTLTPAAMMFPALILAIVPFRIYVLRKYFSEEELLLLDGNKDDEHDQISVEHSLREDENQGKTESRADQIAPNSPEDDKKTDVTNNDVSVNEELKNSDRNRTVHHHHHHHEMNLRTFPPYRPKAGDSNVEAKNPCVLSGLSTYPHALLTCTDAINTTSATHPLPLDHPAGAIELATLSVSKISHTYSERHEEKKMPPDTSVAAGAGTTAASGGEDRIASPISGRGSLNSVVVVHGDDDFDHSNDLTE